MAKGNFSRLMEDIRKTVIPLTGSPQDYDPLIDLVGDARFVLLGEASHGTHEFYRERAEITGQLIASKDFDAVAVEADWPDAYRVNCYVHGVDSIADADDALSGFQHFPSWMWRNTDVLAFVEWLRTRNDSLPSDQLKAGFYGLDLYSLFSSLEAVISYLDRADPQAAQRAREAYACFDHYGRESQLYGYATAFGAAEHCEEEVAKQLADLQEQAAQYSMGDRRVSEDELFYAEQNARVVKDAERYYRTMYRSDVSSWNLRDLHMADTLDELADHLSNRQGRPAKIVVWAHNSHLGDARATEVSEKGELSLGQLVRERHGQDALLVGFSTHSCTVTASSDWDGPPERKRVRPALPNSYEELFHRAGPTDFLLRLRGGGSELSLLREPRLQRAIGVIYRPETERFSHYFQARLADQFDALLHFDRTMAVEPLERTAQWEVGEAPEAGEPPETYPFAA